MKVYQKIYHTLQARNNCINSNNHQWKYKHENMLAYIEKNILPSGSGIDCGTKIYLENFTDNKFELICEFHHMNDTGYYNGWTSHTVIVTPDFVNDISLKIGGKNQNDIKEYLYDLYRCALTDEFTLSDAKQIEIYS